jgi:hypothetical protein
MWQIGSQMENMCATINARDHQKMTEETDTEVKEEDPTIMTIMALTAKEPQDTKTTATKATTAKVWDTAATGKKI